MIKKQYISTKFQYYEKKKNIYSMYLFLSIYLIKILNKEINFDNKIKLLNINKNI